jgi:hypothetical protein
MSDFFTWTTLATVAGATAATAYITQFFKKFSFVQKLNSQGISYLVALMILYTATYFTGKLTVSMAMMIPLNAIVVAFSSNGAYDSVKSTVDTSVSAAETLVNSVKTAITAIMDQVNALAAVMKNTAESPAIQESAGVVAVKSENPAPVGNTDSAAEQAAEVKAETALSGQSN